MNKLFKQLESYEAETNRIAKVRRETLARMRTELIEKACPIKVGDTVKTGYPVYGTDKGVVQAILHGKYDANLRCTIRVALLKKDGNVGARTYDFTFNYPKEVCGREAYGGGKNPVVIKKAA